MKSASKTSIFKEYCHYLHKYKEKYGGKTVVLMQVGSFYEIYAILNDEEELGETNIHHICNNIMNIAVANKTNNMLMAGFQTPYAEKFLKLLINDGYHVVLVNQLSEGSGAERAVKEVLSPGTFMEYSDNVTSNIMSVYIEKINATFVSVGISVIDVSTGNNYVYQIDENLDPDYWKDELSRLINYYSPKEYLFQTKNLKLTQDDIVNYWDVNTHNIQINHYTENTFEGIVYQNEFLQKIFHFESQITPIEELNMVHCYQLRCSYIYMLQYIYEHKQDIIQNINYPDKINDIKHLSIAANGVRQLNVIQNYSYYKGKNESLYSICDECGFIGGKRLLKERLVYPSIEPDVLNSRYSKVELFMKDNFYKELKPDISKLTDTEKALRKLGLNTLTPPLFLNTKLSYDFIIRIIDILHKNDFITNNFSEYTGDVSQFKQFYEHINKLFNFKNMISPDKPYFKQGVYPDLDEVYKITEVSRKNLELISSRLSNIIDSNKDGACKFDHNDRTGYFLYCTKNRSKILGKRFENIPNQMINIRDSNGDIVYQIHSSSFTFSNKDNSNVFIESNEIKNLTDELSTNTEKIKQLNSIYWQQITNTIYSEYKDILLRVHKFISEIDVTCAAAKVAVEYRYSKPVLVESDKACLDAKDMRHPIVERISTDTEYVTNNVILGKDKKDGILLFGTNACGKSTLMKAVGLNIILAQAGFYVACASFHFKPYTQIFTRILNNDNIFRSQSSFAVEVMELRSIFQMCDENSLILGDELCSGTESSSALAIVSNSIKTLTDKNVSFMITSHLHELTEIPLVKEIENINIYHLKIRCDGGVLIYDRKLCDGSGPPIYGLTVCEAMGMSAEFVKGSNEVLNYLQNKKENLVSTKLSQYSSNVFMDECKVCGGLPEETHHIKEQCTADENGMIDHHHKNNNHNLVVLCKSCHSKVTYGGLLIHGWKHTSRGKQLDYEYVSNDSKKSKKYTQEQIDIILGYKSLIDDEILNKTGCLNLIDSEHGFRPSMKVFTDIINGRY